jgi:hypothetical protein
MLLNLFLGEKNCDDTFSDNFVSRVRGEKVLQRNTNLIYIFYIC